MNFNFPSPRYLMVGPLKRLNKFKNDVGAWYQSFFPTIGFVNKTSLKNFSLIIKFL